MNDLEITKIDISDNKIKEVNDYGIYRYFYENDFENRKKLVSAVVDNTYIINTQDAYKSDHYGMITYINERYGKFDFYMASIGDELNFFADNELNSPKINIILNSLKELKRYCNKFNKEKEIRFIGCGFDKELKNSDNIDNIIEILKGREELDSMIESTFEEIDFNDMTNFI